jgi:6-phosphogluconolactonase
VNEEAGSKVHAFAWDSESGTLSPIGLPLSTLVDANETGHTADLQLSPDGHKLYCANRGSNGVGIAKQDTIATFSVDQASGALELIAHTDVGVHPRHFRIDPSGQWMIATAMHENCACQPARVCASLAEVLG